MKVIFAGTPEFAAVALESLLQSSHRVIAVLTQPDRPSGRGLKMTASPVKQLAHLYQLPVYQPVSLKDEHEQKFIESLKADVIVVAAYGLLLPAALLHATPFGCINIHPSLLPRWRGAAPIPRAIYAGDTISGVTIMQMDQGLDTGPILLQRQYILEPDETAQTLHDHLAEVGAKALVDTLDLLANQQIKMRVQDNLNATYAHKISKEEALLDWEQPATDLEHAVRAFIPWPVAHTSWQGQTLRIWQAKALNEKHQAQPRTILACDQHGIDIAAGQGVLRVLKLQLPGGKVLSFKDFYNAKSKDLKIGDRFI